MMRKVARSYFYENQMENLRKEQQKLIDEAVSKITKSFEEQTSKLIAERDSALLAWDDEKGNQIRIGRVANDEKGSWKR